MSYTITDHGPNGTLDHVIAECEGDLCDFDAEAFCHGHQSGYHDKANYVICTHLNARRIVIEVRDPMTNALEGQFTIRQLHATKET